MLIIVAFCCYVNKKPAPVLTGFPQRLCYNGGMEVIYVDSLFLLDLIIDYSLLLLSGRVSGVVLRRRRYFLGAMVGAVYAVCMVLPGMQWLENTALKLVLGLLMSLIAYGSETRFWRCAAVFFAVTALFGGAVLAASLLVGAEPLGGTFVSVSLRVLALSFGVSYFVVMRLFQRQAIRAARRIQTVELWYARHAVTLRALRDTGNALHDPASGRAVIVAEREAVKPLLPADLPSDPTEAVLRMPGCRLLPCRTVGAASTLLLCFCPESVIIDGKREEYLVALTLNRLSEDGSYQALLPGEEY